MKLEEYIKCLLAFAQQNPEALGMDVIYAKDDEGNGYCRGVNEPSLYQVDDGYNCDTECDEDDDDFQPNAVCIN